MKEDIDEKWQKQMTDIRSMMIIIPIIFLLGILSMSYLITALDAPPIIILNDTNSDYSVSAAAYINDSVPEGTSPFFKHTDRAELKAGQKTLPFQESGLYLGCVSLYQDNTFINSLYLPYPTEGEIREHFWTDEYVIKLSTLKNPCANLWQEVTYK